MSKIITPAEMAARLRIDRSRVYRLAETYNIGTKLDNRMRVYTEEDVVTMQAHSTGVPGRPRRLSESLELAASTADDQAEQLIKDGDAEAANMTIRLAGHMRRLSTTHVQSEQDPIQTA